ncbi:MAG: outer membrane beta-barrel protein [Dysgonamonadaceae bacterium]|nr:outer membrane beta-barrel protein [Dysgonamonadaceae bacterium]
MNKQIILRAIGRMMSATVGFVFCSNVLFAQIQYDSEFAVGAGLGCSSFDYGFLQKTGTSNTSGLGGTLGVSYTRFFSRNIGLSFGLEAGVYNASFTVDAARDEYSIATPPGLQGSFLLRADYSGIEEKHSVVFLQIPLMLQFQAPVSGSAFFYFGAGGKIGIPVSPLYKQSVKSVITTGYSDYTAQTYQNMPNHGFDSYSDIQTDGTFKTGIPYMLSLESGIKFGKTGKTPVYTGFYLDYGLNNIQKTSDSKLLEYNESNPSNPVWRGVVENASLVNKIKPFALGLKIRVAFGSGKGL